MADAATPAQPDFMKQLAAALAAAGAGIGGRAIANAQGNPLTQAVPPQVSQLLDQSVQRQAYQNPLFQATTQGVYDMLPDFAKTGTQLSGTLSNVAPTAPMSGASGPGLGTAAGLGGLSALAALLGQGGGASSGGPLGPIFDAIKKLFHRNSSVGTNGNTGQPLGELGVPNSLDPFWQGPSNDPFSQGTQGSSPNVTTDYNFGSDPNLSAYLPTDWGSLPGYGTDPNAGGGASGDWWNP